MPYTVAHAAAVLPLARFARGRYLLSALVVGSMAPDFEYYLRLRPHSEWGHSPSGLLLFALPAGLVVLYLYHAVVRDPALHLLPRPFRRRLAHQPATAPGSLARAALASAICILAGAATHVVWDAFTHANGWGVAAAPALLGRVQLGGSSVPAYKALQHASTAVGMLVIGVWTVGWLARTPPVPGRPAEFLTRGERLVTSGIIALATLLAAILAATLAASEGAKTQAVVVRTVVAAMSAFAAAMLAYGVGFSAALRRGPPDTGDAGTQS